MSINFLGIAIKLRYGFSKKAHLCKTQTVSFLEPLEISYPIIDLGGGGEGVIGQLYKELVTAVDSRQEELDETPDGPTKVCADAKNLPFEDGHFGSATAFYFFMYLHSEDYKDVFKETLRVLKPGGLFYIWDTMIPKRTNELKEMFLVPVIAKLPNKIISTAYGVKWSDRDMNIEILSDLSREVGFSIVESKITKNSFQLICQKPMIATKE